MSFQCGKVVSLILSERFGPVVEKVGTYLFQHGTSPLMYIKKHTELPVAKIKESLCILIKYSLVLFVPNKNENIANYSLKTDKVLLMLRYPKFISLIKKKFGEEAEILLEELFLKGYATGSELILKVVERLKENQENSVSLQEIRDQFVSLAVAKYFIRLPISNSEDKPVPTIKANEDREFQVPEIDLKILNSIIKGTEPNAVPSDAGLYWTVNFDRFHQDMRDKLIINAIVKKFDENAGELMKNLLQQMYMRTAPWSDVSNPIPIREVKDMIEKKNTHPELIVFFDQYVNILEQDSKQIIRKVGEASGGSYQLYIKSITNELTWETIEQIVLEKFDSKAARIFRLVRTKRFIEPDQIQQLAMIPAKEAKRLTYQLLEENFVQLQELKKSAPSSGPNKSFTLFYIQIDQVIRMVLELCYKSLFNVTTRRHHDKVANKRIIDKKLRVDTIILGMRVQGASDEQLADIEEMITPPEREHLDKIGKKMKKLNSVELEIDETLFLLEMYFIYE